MIWLALACGRPAEPAPEPAVAAEPVVDPRPALDLPLACAPGCARAERARGAVQRAVGWLDAQISGSEGRLTEEALASTLPIAERFRSATLDHLIAVARPRADHPGDPRRRLFDPTARLPTPPSEGFTATPGAELHPNRPLVEALYCPEHGLRESTVRWLCEDFRDAGGPKSTHAAWYQVIAVEGGCLARSATCLDELAAELRDAALTEPPPATTEAIDRLGEQILFGLLADADPRALEPAVDKLLDRQQSDGAFTATPSAPLDRSQLHATMVGAWALTEWLARAM